MKLHNGKKGLLNADGEMKRLSLKNFRHINESKKMIVKRMDQTLIAIVDRKLVMSQRQLDERVTHRAPKGIAKVKPE